ncbi:MAG: hypothetical protein JWL81_1329 [Verrucomicrobiales bacterium]|nr:hypothetical protein [Verrucomicrobiales bacterium]
MTAKRLFQPLLLAACLTTALPAFAQQPAPHAAPAANTTPQPTEVDALGNEATILPIEGLVRLEVFSLPQETSRTATRKFPKHSDLYDWLGAELEKENSTVKLERLMVLRVRGGQKSKLEEIDEYPTATGFSLPQIPQSFTLTAPAPPQNPENQNPPAQSATPAGPTLPWPSVPPLPTNITFVKTGWTTEIELTFSEDGKVADLNLAPEFVGLLGLESHDPAGAVRQPLFETSKLSAQIITQTGKPTLAGTLNPPVDPATPGCPMEPVNRLLFITVTDPR